MLKLLVDLILLPLRLMWWAVKNVCWIVLIGLGLFL